jgi:hypothetical protein
VTIKYTDENEDEGADEPAEETVTMLVTPEDVSVLFDRCGDLSLAARKQALISLTDLLLSRPHDEVLQDAWVSGALPLASDPESSVQAKLAQCTHDLLIKNALSWAAKQQQKQRKSTSNNKQSRRNNSKSGDSNVDDSEEEEVNPVWAICTRICNTGQLNFPYP